MEDSTVVGADPEVKALKDQEALLTEKLSKMASQQSRSEGEAKSSPGLGTEKKTRSKVQCYNCQGWGHVAKECPSKTQRLRGKPYQKKSGGQESEKRDYSHMTCFYCRQVGHHIKDCPEKKAKEQNEQLN